MKKSPVIKKTVLIGLILTLASAMVWAIQFSYKVPAVVKAPDRPHEGGKKKIVYDKKLLEKLSGIGRASEKSPTDRLIEGAVLTRSGAGKDADKIGFAFYIKDSSLYYRMGDTEMLNDSGTYLFIDHVAKQVVVGKQKKIQLNAPLPSIKDIAERLQGEEYELKGSVSGSIQTLTMINETHVTCRQFDIAYDTTSMTIRHLYARYADTADPTSRLNEKVIEVEISVWKSSPDRPAAMHWQSVVRRNGESWKLTEKYADHRLVLL